MYSGQHTLVARHFGRSWDRDALRGAPKHPFSGELPTTALFAARSAHMCQVSLS